MASISEQLKYIMSLDASQAIKSFEKVGATADKELSKADKKLDKLGGNLTKVGAGAIAFAGIAGAGLVKVALGASDLAESVNAVNVTFGEAADGILQLGEDAARAVGLSKVEFNGLAVQFSSFAEVIAGEGGDVVGTMSEMTTRVADFASVMNLDVPEAARIFQSALAGETEPIKKFGIDLSAASVAAHAVEMGIVGAGEAMTAAQKTQATYSLLMQSTAKTAGDFANTSDGLANQQRILKAEFKNLADDIGTGILPMLTSVVSVAGKVLGAFSELSPETKAMAGRFAAIGVAGVGLIGTISLVAGQVIKMRDRFVDSTGSLTAFGKAAKGVGVAMGVIAIGAAAYSVYASEKAKATARTEEFVTALKAEEDGQADATAAVLAARFAHEDYQQVMDETGLSAADLASFIRGSTTPAMAAYLSSIESVTPAGRLFVGALEAQRDSLAEAEERVAAETKALEEQTGGTAEATEATEAFASSTENLKAEMEGGISTSEVALQAAEALATANENAAQAAEDHAEAMDVQADAFADSAAAALDWMGDLQGSMESAGGAISTFTDEALGDIDTFQQELSDNTHSLSDWQTDIVAIAAATSPEFAGFLAEMGLAGSKLVDDLANNEGELATTFDQWKLAAAVAARDVPGEIAKADPETQRIIERLGRNVISTLDGNVAPTKTASKAVGQAIVDGMRAGVDAGARQVGTAAAKVVTDALAAAKAAGDISSPSKLFLDEVGVPIAEGIEEGITEGADAIGKALDRAIKDAEKDALDAVDDLVDAAKDRFADAWGAADDARDMERLNERVSDAQTGVAEAQEKVNETAAEFGRGSKEHRKALESLSDAERSLRDANFALLEASEALIDQGPAGVASFVALGTAAGLTRAEIDALILAYRQLAIEQQNADAARAAIDQEAAAAQDTRARFGNAAAAGLVPQEWIDHIAQFTDDPRFVVELMNAFLNTLPNFAGGGIVPGPIGSPQLVVAHGGEQVGMNGNGTSGLSVVVQPGGIVLSGTNMSGRDVVEALATYVRQNGPAAVRRVVTGV